MFIALFLSSVFTNKFYIVVSIALSYFQVVFLIYIFFFFKGHITVKISKHVLLFPHDGRVLCKKKYCIIPPRFSFATRVLVFPSTLNASSTISTTEYVFYVVLVRFNRVICHMGVCIRITRHRMFLRSYRQKLVMKIMGNFFFFEIVGVTAGSSFVGGGGRCSWGSRFQ